MGIANKGKRIWKNKPLIYLSCPRVCSSLQGNFEGWQESVVLPCPKEMDMAPAWREKPFQGLSRNSGCPNWCFLISLVNSSALKTENISGSWSYSLTSGQGSGAQHLWPERSLLPLESHPGGRRGLTCQPCQPQHLILL